MHVAYIRMYVVHTTCSQPHHTKVTTHRYGFYWREQNKKSSFRCHTIISTRTIRQNHIQYRDDVDTVCARPRHCIEKRKYCRNWIWKKQGTHTKTYERGISNYYYTTSYGKLLILNKGLYFIHTMLSAKLRPNSSFFFTHEYGRKVK